MLGLNAVAPTRLRLGLGPGGAGNERIYGIPYGKPLGHLREYVTILRTLFATGQIDFDGKHYHAHARPGAATLPSANAAGGLPPLTLEVPLLTSALQRELRDGSCSGDDRRGRSSDRGSSNPL